MIYAYIDEEDSVIVGRVLYADAKRSERSEKGV